MAEHMPAGPGPEDEKEEQAAQRKATADNKDLWRYVSLGTQLTVTVALFSLLGWWLDEKFGWTPWGLVVAGMLGVAAGLYHFIKEALR
jgi:F0F1-type ATP synthase assembly protein I